MNSLIVYGTKHGTTEECSFRIKEMLEGSTDVYNVKNLPRDMDVSKYDTVIIGGSIYTGFIQKSIKNFVNRYKADLASTENLGIFMCNYFPKSFCNNYLSMNFPSTLLNKAKAVGLFGGKILPEKLSLVEKAMVGTIKITRMPFFEFKDDNLLNFVNKMKSN